MDKDFESMSDSNKSKFGKSIVKKWNNIRDLYRKYVKTIKSIKSGDGATKRKKYIYFDQLRFLDNGLEERQVEDTLPGEPEEQAQEQTREKENVNIQSQQNENSIPKKQDNNFQQDHPQVSFLKGILPMIADFSCNENIEFQMSILQCVRDIKSRRLQQVNSLQYTQQPLSFHNGQPLQHIPHYYHSYPYPQPSTSQQKNCTIPQQSNPQNNVSIPQQPYNISQNTQACSETYSNPQNIDVLSLTSSMVSSDSNIDTEFF
ncbi:hypothetical protein FQR65_LT16334 [Abscondita terminalis]|nr:hypothetical protein FQR65_LT16334 [Abscondita terminalis]